MGKEAREMTKDELHEISEKLDCSSDKSCDYIAVSHSPKKGMVKLVMVSGKKDVMGFVEMPPLAIISMLSTMSAEVAGMMNDMQNNIMSTVEHLMAEVECETREGDLDA